VKDLLVIVPTRGRPGNVSRQQLAMMETRTTVADVLYAVDDDDPHAMGYARLDGIDLAIGPRMRLVGTLNFHAARLSSQYRNIGFMGDDHLPRTAFWDQEVANSLGTGSPRVVYGNDLFQGGNLATAAFMPSRMVEALGYMAPPELVHLYVDNAWMELGRSLDGLVYREDVVIEHMHPFAGKGVMDPGYQEVNSAAVNDADKVAFEAWREDPDGLAAAVARIRREYGL
jgi:hypothetical protein